MTDKERPTKSEAIQRVLETVPLTDYLEVVTAVEKQFGIKVSQRDVEQTWVAMKQEAEAREAAEASAMQADNGGDRSEIGAALRFVEEMGSFEQARAAIDQLEQTLKKLQL